MNGKGIWCMCECRHRHYIPFFISSIIELRNIVRGGLFALVGVVSSLSSQSDFITCRSTWNIFI